jgi:hypothetical protein
MKPVFPQFHRFAVGLLHGLVRNTQLVVRIRATSRGRQDMCPISLLVFVINMCFTLGEVLKTK